MWALQVLGHAPRYQAILNRRANTHLDLIEDPLELQTQGSKYTGAMATLFSAIGTAYMGDVAAGALINLCNHTSKAL